jgi:hypothetical protein
MRPFRPLRAAVAVALGLAASPALSCQEALDTPRGLARAEGERGSEEPLRLVVGERELYRTEEWLDIWPEAVAGDWLLLGLTEGGTACGMMWAWVHLDSGAASEVFGTCGMVEGVSVRGDGIVTARAHSYDPDWPMSDFVFDGSEVVEIPRPQAPAAVPPGAPADEWIGRAPFELFRASDWRGPLSELMGKESYDEAQSAFGQVVAFEAQGDWVAASGCMAHACLQMQGAIAIHRGDGRILVALLPHGEPPRLYGEPRGPLPPSVEEIMSQF